MWIKLQMSHSLCAKLVYVISGTLRLVCVYSCVVSVRIGVGFGSLCPYHACIPPMFKSYKSVTRWCMEIRQPTHRAFEIHLRPAMSMATKPGPREIVWHGSMFDLHLRPDGDRPFAGLAMWSAKCGPVKRAYGETEHWAVFIDDMPYPWEETWRHCASTRIGTSTGEPTSWFVYTRPGAGSCATFRPVKIASAL